VALGLVCCVFVRQGVGGEWSGETETGAALVGGKRKEWYETKTGAAGEQRGGVGRRETALVLLRNFPWYY